jgi:hypothetical protein
MTNEIKRISNLFKKLYDGSPWIEINITSVLQNISAEQGNYKSFN